MYVFMYVCMYVSACLSIYIIIYLSACLSPYLFFCLSTGLPACLSVSLCVPVCVLAGVSATCLLVCPPAGPWGTGKVKGPSVENPELSGSPFQAWGIFRLLPWISSLINFTFPVHSPSFFPRLFPSFSCVSCG